ncbi:MAG: DUF362 domain-containing protein [Chitinivibrionales bacterium]|nr:DUF362 domain-containing protein [Chitinivibrionales bacterium]
MSKTGGNMAISRRNFIKTGPAATAATMTMLSPKARAQSYPSANQFPGRIVEVIDSDMNPGNVNTASSENTVLDAQVQDMFDEGIKRLTGKNSVQQAMETLFPQKNKVVALKVNTISGRIVTRKEVVKAVITRLISEGITTGDNIKIYDSRNNWAGMSNSYFGTSNVTIDNINGQFNQHSSDPIKNEHNQNIGYADPLFEADYLINIPVMKSHTNSGIGAITLAFKNHWGTVRPDCGNADKLIAVNGSPPIRDKTRLVVMSALHATYNGGPTSTSSAYTLKTIFLGTDPVTNDFVGRMRINEKRDEMGMSPKNTSSNAIPERGETAGLGIASSNGLITMDMASLTVSRSNGIHINTSQYLRIISGPKASAVKISLAGKQWQPEKVTARVYDLSGQLVYTQPGISGKTFVWHKQNQKGRTSAQGRYLAHFTQDKAAFWVSFAI